MLNQITISGCSLKLNVTNGGGDVYQSHVSTVIKRTAYLQTGTSHQLETGGLPVQQGHHLAMW